MTRSEAPAGPDGGPGEKFDAYQGCWVALIGDQVAGVGHTAEAARLAARHSRPRERISAVRFVPEEHDTQHE